MLHIYVYVCTCIYTYIMSIDDECYGEYKAEEWDGESEEAFYILNKISGDGLPERLKVRKAEKMRDEHVNIWKISHPRQK